MIRSATRQERRAFGVKLHEIEGNPLSAEQIALFEQFDREGLSNEQRRAILIGRAQKRAAG
jgi:hypothetical protein